MKTKNYIKAIAVLFVLLFAKNGLAQSPCQPTISLNTVSGGTVLLSATIPNTTTPGYYQWNFGNGSTFTGTNNGSAATNYTANGNYTITMCFVNAAFTCTGCTVYTVNITGACSLAASFNTTMTGTGSYMFTSTSTNTTGATVYNWNFGDGNTATGPVANHTYTNDGNYNVLLTVTDNSNGNCSNIAWAPVTVCTQTVALTATYGANGAVSFTALGASSPTATNYYGNYGDGTGFSGSSPTFNHTYLTNGTFTVSVAMASTFGCTTTAQYVVTISNIVNPCNINAAFNYVVSGSGYVVNFNNTSTGTSGGVTYNWNFGDGNSSSSTSPTHTYATGGTYSVTLTANNNYSYTCLDSVTYVITMPTCTYVPTFTAVVGSNGYVTFVRNSPSSGTVSSYWSFGNGLGNSAWTNTTNTTYTANGTYTVTLSTVIWTPQGPCTATVTGVVTITNVCTANATFSLSPSGTPQYWNAIPSATNIAAATWYWGDGTTSNTLYTSHTYSAAGFYTICLTVTTTCGSVNTYCAIWNIFKPANADEANGFVYVNVLDPNAPTGIKNVSAANMTFNVAPNPNSGSFNISVNGLKADNATISIRNMMGQEIYSTQAPVNNGNIDTTMQTEAANGVYFIKVSAGDQTLTQKIVITK